MAASVPYVRVDGGAAISGTDLAVTEGSDVDFWVEHDGSLAVSWTGPGGLTGSSDSIRLKSIRPTRSGSYTCTLVNEQGCVTEYTFNLSVAWLDLDVHEAESFIGQFGIRLESCKDWGGGKYVGYIEDGDWCQYLIHFDESGYYTLTARVAAGSGGGSMEISTRDSLLGTLLIDGDPAGGWDNWMTTRALEVAIGEGYQILQFTFRGGEGSLFNFNWFDLQFDRAFEVTFLKERPEVGVFPNPVISEATIVYTLTEPSKVDLQIVNGSGSLVRSFASGELMQPGIYSVNWNPSDHGQGSLPGGVYFIRFRCDDAVLTRKVVLVSGF
jgi:hypothetical protein